MYSKQRDKNCSTLSKRIMGVTMAKALGFKLHSEAVHSHTAQPNRVAEGFKPHPKKTGWIDMGWLNDVGLERVKERYRKFKG